MRSTYMSKPVFDVSIVPYPSNAFPETDDLAVRNTSGASLKAFGKVT